jgi:hypothetical protein
MVQLRSFFGSISAFGLALGLSATGANAQVRPQSPEEHLLYWIFGVYEGSRANPTPGYLRSDERWPSFARTSAKPLGFRAAMGPTQDQRQTAFDDSFEVTYNVIRESNDCVFKVNRSYIYNSRTSGVPNVFNEQREYIFDFKYIESNVVDIRTQVYSAFYIHRDHFQACRTRTSSSPEWQTCWPVQRMIENLDEMRRVTPALRAADALRSLRSTCSPPRF